MEDGPGAWSPVPIWERDLDGVPDLALVCTSAVIGAVSQWVEDFSLPSLCLCLLCPPAFQISNEVNLKKKKKKINSASSRALCYKYTRSRNAKDEF